MGLSSEAMFALYTELGRIGGYSDNGGGSGTGYFYYRSVPAVSGESVLILVQVAMTDGPAWVTDDLFKVVVQVREPKMQQGLPKGRVLGEATEWYPKKSANAGKLAKIIDREMIQPLLRST